MFLLSVSRNYIEGYREFHKYEFNKISSATIHRILVFMVFWVVVDTIYPLIFVSSALYIVTEETINDVKAYLEENLNSSIRKAVQAILKRETSEDFERYHHNASVQN